MRPRVQDRLEHCRIRVDVGRPHDQQQCLGVNAVVDLGASPHSIIASRTPRCTGARRGDGAAAPAHQREEERVLTAEHRESGGSATAEHLEGVGIEASRPLASRPAMFGMWATRATLAHPDRGPCGPGCCATNGTGLAAAAAGCDDPGLGRAHVVRNDDERGDDAQEVFAAFGRFDRARVVGSRADDGAAPAAAHALVITSMTSCFSARRVRWTRRCRGDDARDPAPRYSPPGARCPSRRPARRAERDERHPDAAQIEIARHVSPTRRRSQGTFGARLARDPPMQRSVPAANESAEGE